MTLPGAEATGSTSELLPPWGSPGGGMRQVPRLKTAGAEPLPPGGRGW